MRLFAIALVLAAAIAGPLHAAPKSDLPPGARPQDIDRLAARVQQTFDVPGLAVAIVKDGKVAFAKGYGVREAGTPGAVDSRTLFGIGSNTKAFTVAALAMLVDQGKLSWDDRVIDKLPDFRLSDPYVTREITVRDLLTHRSGLALGSGDLMLVPPTDFTRAEMIRNLRHFPLASSFRSKFAYDNMLYLAAGEITPAVTGVSWEDYVQTRILDRLGTGCAATLSMTGDNPNVARPHAMVDGKLTKVTPDRSTAYDPAGSIQCNADGMAAWMILQLKDGRMADGSQLFSAAQHREMWTPQTLVTPLPANAAETRTHFRAYGLAWFLDDYQGALRVSHTGGLIGMVSAVTLLPEKGVGIVVLTNQQSAGRAAMMQSLVDAMLGQPPRDWVATLSRQEAELNERAAAAERAVAVAAGQPFLPLDAYVGTYRDPWRGDVTVSRQGDHLRMSFSRTTGLQGDLRPVKGNVFVVRWDDRTLKADALVNFRTGLDGAVSGAAMAPLSPTTDFSFDYRDLDFTRVAARSPEAGG